MRHIRKEIYFCSIEFAFLFPFEFLHGLLVFLLIPFPEIINDTYHRQNSNSKKKIGPP